MGRPKLKFYFDNDVPDEAAEVLRGFGHDVVFTRERLSHDAPDKLVATQSYIERAILVCFDKDQKPIVRRMKTLSLIKLGCTQPRAAERLRGAISLIEFEFDWCRKNARDRMYLHIGKEVIRTHR